MLTGNAFVAWAVGALGAFAVTASACLLAFASTARAEQLQGIHKIQHVVMIMQENRSFDTYFGTYPGANGIPAGTCVPDPATGGCAKPYYNPVDGGQAGPHGTEAAIADVDGGKMDGFIAQAVRKDECEKTGGCGKCPKPAAECGIEVVGYHDARNINNYWTYAKDFSLQDNMFESQASWSLPEHLALVSAWSALCSRTEPENPMACASSLNPKSPSPSWQAPLQPGRTAYPWTDLTYLMDKAGVSWRYYVHEGIEPDCQDDEATSCEKVVQNAKTPGIWNPLAAFTDVKQDGQLGNIQPLPRFYEAAGKSAECGLPNVAWIVPDLRVSEHPPEAVSDGQAYVTTLINTIMRSPCWGSTAIFLSWDDWGGFYDHVNPPAVDQNGYGLRVPGLVVSAYSRAGHIDHQQLSHDAYLKFIEDDFLAGSRLNPSTDGRPDSRTSVREETPGLGNLTADFNFEQSPRPPVVLPSVPPAGASSAPPGSQQPPALEALPASGIAGGSATLHATVNPDGGAVTECRFEYAPQGGPSSSVPCESTPGAGTKPIEVAAPVGGLSGSTSYHFRLLATNAGGTSTGPELTFSTQIAPPLAETDAASFVSSGSATLNASVNPNGSGVTVCEFEYGLSGSYGTTVPCASLPGSGTAPVPVSAAVSGLGAARTYHFRIVASNEGGATAQGIDHTFTTLPPVPAVTGVEPSAGLSSGGTAVTITGSDLAEASAVRFGGSSATSFNVSSPTSIAAVAPAGSGTVDVTVTSGGGTSEAGSADRFTYVPAEAHPSIKAVEPSSGPAAGGTSVSIIGKHFTGATAVTFGPAGAASITRVSSTEVTVVTPPQSPGTVPVTVTTPNGSSAASSKAQFTFSGAGAGAGVDRPSRLTGPLETVG